MIDLFEHESRRYSEHGEDGVIAAIFQEIGAGPYLAVEIGAGDGTENNTRALREDGWAVLAFDAVHVAQGIRCATVTPHNVQRFLSELTAMPSFLSVDIDSVDWYVVEEILEVGYRPRCVVVEYNANFQDDRVVTRDAVKWDGTVYFGATLRAWVVLFALYGYRLVYCESSGANAFFVQGTYAHHFKNAGDEAALFRPPAYPPHAPTPPRAWARASDLLEHR